MVPCMRKTTVRRLRDDASTVLAWVAAGESVEVRHRNKTIAIISPPPGATGGRRPDFAARLRAIYGRRVLRTTGSDLMSESRGES